MAKWITTKAQGANGSVTFKSKSETGDEVTTKRHAEADLTIEGAVAQHLRHIERVDPAASFDAHATPHEIVQALRRN